MTILGPRSLMDIAVPLGVDANEVMRFEMQAGVTPVETIQMAATIIGEANESLIQRYGGLLSLTERVWTRVRVGDGTRRMTPLKADFVLPDGARSEKIGHMLPRNDYNDATEWERDYLERANMEDLRDDALAVRDSWVNRVDYEIITRALTTTEVVISATSWSPGWAIGTGTNLDYIPPQFGGNVFDSTHSHYVRIDGAVNATNLAAALNDAKMHLGHHGLGGRLVALVSDTDLDTYAAMPKFVEFVPTQFRTIAGNANAPVHVADGEVQGIPGELFGYFLASRGPIELRAHERIPTGRGFVTKSFGINNANNGLAIRTEAGKGFGLMLDPQVNRSLSPALDKIMFRATHGVGVMNRLNGFAFQVEAGSTTYTNPEIG